MIIKNEKIIIKKISEKCMRFYSSVVAEFRSLWGSGLMNLIMPRKVSRKKCFPSVILRLAWRGVVYFVGRERNARIFNDVSSFPLDVPAQVMHSVQLRLHNDQIASFSEFCCWWKFSYVV
jgi:hypothetical protein